MTVRVKLCWENVTVTLLGEHETVPVLGTGLAVHAIVEEALHPLPARKEIEVEAPEELVERREMEVGELEVLLMLQAARAGGMNESEWTIE